MFDEVTDTQKLFRKQVRERIDMMAAAFMIMYDLHPDQVVEMIYKPIALVGETQVERYWFEKKEDAGSSMELNPDIKDYIKKMAASYMTVTRIPPNEVAMVVEWHISDTDDAYFTVTYQSWFEKRVK